MPRSLPDQIIQRTLSVLRLCPELFSTTLPWSSELKPFLPNGWSFDDGALRFIVPGVTTLVLNNRSYNPDRDADLPLETQIAHACDDLKKEGFSAEEALEVIKGLPIVTSEFPDELTHEKSIAYFRKHPEKKAESLQILRESLAAYYENKKEMSRQRLKNR